MLQYREYQSHPALVPYVSCFWSFLADPLSRSNVDHRVLPDGCLDIVFIARSTGPGVPCDLRAVGTMTRFIEVEAMPITLGVRFRPGMARRFFGLPAAELTDLQIDLFELWGDDGKRLHEKMSRTACLEARRGLLESALLQRLTLAHEDQRVVAAVQEVMRSGGRVRLSDMAGSIGLSERQLRRCFEDAVGLTPKRFARVIRFRGILDLVSVARQSDRDSTIDWASLAADRGYYDQAHMINEFRDFTGQTPVQYLVDRRTYGT